MSEQTRFDVMVHLLGEQRLPVYLGIRQFECAHHIIVHSGIQSGTQDALERLLPPDVTTVGVKVPPYGPSAVRNAILSALGDTTGLSIGFNLTGGTKLMFAGASVACKEVSGTPFYFETKKNELIWIGQNFERSSVLSVESVDPFFTLAGFKILEAGRWADDPARGERAELTKSLWPLARKLASIYRDVAPYNDSPGRPFQVEKRGVIIQLDKSDTATICIDKFRYQKKHWPDFARYITGGWFEEYCGLLLLPLLEKGEIRDLRIGLRIDWQDPLPDRNRLGAQEFDLAFTDGHSLFLVECKAGSVKSEYIMTLENHVRHYGGVVAKGALVSVFPPLATSTIRKVKDSHAISGFWADGVERKLSRNIIAMVPGQTFGRIGESKSRANYKSKSRVNYKSKSSPKYLRTSDLGHLEEVFRNGPS